MYLLNKFLYSIITLFGVVTVIFFLFSVLPGDPAQMMLGQNDNSEQLINIKKSMLLTNQLASNTYFILMIYPHFQFILKTLMITLS